MSTAANRTGQDTDQPDDLGCGTLAAMWLRYVGSGPYCYANSLAMVMGGHGPDPSAIEVLTGSPFGVCLLDGATPFFDPPGWDPGIGLDAAVDLLGWTCERTGGGTASEAIERLRESSARWPVLAGPVEFGLLLHHPDSGEPVGSDHFVVVMGVEQDTVRFHDPHGHPHATLPVQDFAAAWRAETIGYHPEPFTMRTGFRVAREVDLLTALQRSLPAAVQWLTDGGQLTASGTIGGYAACQRLADLAGAGLEPWQRDHLSYFAIRVGARRLTDAAAWLDQVGAFGAAEIADQQARLVGALQYTVVANDRPATAQLAPTYEHMRGALDTHIRTAD